ncbi:PEPxxWA-CTERM sorting domain-containing protein [Phenylobacterium kunshanense]|uniref:Ice-binding protein C-terminal domain-containing protein n=1 Tax=Phenylobacterium kunshanense TaxID=1445034 RepID=A0A328BIP6_9CAUL|nr:PEPxxWA-CTERM sorting domain-containing protein [Phenylobacterium kunshanense]RAK67170.1 hypothetical protein DJ019_04315 [Phenylobacterium kunshanense]
MNLKSMLFGAALACGLVVGSAASAATIVTMTTRDNVEAVTGLTGGTVINFEDIAPGAYTQLTKNGVTFSGTGSVSVDSQFSGQYNLQGKALKGVSNKGMFFDFDAPITGFGFFFGASDLVWTLAAYDANDNLLETLQISPTRHNNLGNFYGIKANGIASARLTTTSADYVGIDDFRTSTAPLVNPGAVPEPASWALMILGFGAAGALLRRNSASRPVVA